jgi:hypothetical protein
MTQLMGSLMAFDHRSQGIPPRAVDLILREVGVPPGWIGGGVDGCGNIVARTTDEGFKIGRPASEAAPQTLVRAPGGFYRGRTLEGVEVDVAYRFLPHTDGWSVHFGISSDLLNTPVEQSQYLLAGGATISLALAAILSTLVASEKLNLRTRADIVRYGVAHGWLDDL